MRCPFLREAQVKSCCASTYKKMIVRTSGQAVHERCSSKDWVTCPSAKQHNESNPVVERCPFLQESLVQYCSAAPTSKYVPYNDGPSSHCVGDSHKYCELYLSMTKMDEHVEPAVSQQPGPSGQPHLMVHDIPVPSDLAFAPNHMWIDVADDRTCHVGVDGLLARVLGRIDGLSFVTTKGAACPTVALNVHGTDLMMTFPNQLVVTGLNTYLRSRPGNLTTHPYTLGWLFEGTDPKPHEGEPAQRPDDGCLRGKQALEWMTAETNRITGYVNERLLPSRQKEFVTMMDGGIFVDGLVNYLTREETLQFFNEFFSQTAKWRFTT